MQTLYKTDKTVDANSKWGRTIVLLHIKKHCIVQVFEYSFDDP